MDSEFRLCPACRAPNTVQDAACVGCGAPLPKVARVPVPTFEAIPGRQEARQAARTGVRRGLVVGVASAAVLGLLVARTFRSPSLQDGYAQTANAPQEAAPAPLPTAQPAGMAPGAAVPVMAGLEQPNPYANANPAMPQPGLAPTAAGTSVPADGSLAVPVSGPASTAGTVPAVIIAAPTGRPRPSPETSQGRGGSKAASYTDDDLARVRSEAEPTPAPEAQPTPAASPAPPARYPAREEAGEGRLRERREAVRAAQQRLDEAQASVNDIRREARENDDDGLQEELSAAVAALKSAQRDLARARRALQDLEDQRRPVLPPQ